MTRVFDDPAAFADEALAGFAAAYPGYVVRLDGGVARAAASRSGQVAVVIGGGSGHYPAFAGLVGAGLATAAVCGQVFASPSAGQAYRVARAVESGGGVLFSYGNYAGDRMQFGQAEQRLRSEGIDARTVVVTDDIASAPLDHMGDRADRRRPDRFQGGRVRGRVRPRAGRGRTARSQGQSPDAHPGSGVHRLHPARRGRPASSAVPSGQMSIGLGIHGEPGISDVPLPSAHDLAQLLVARLLAERPEGVSDRAVVLLNGLGTVKYEELLVLDGTQTVQQDHGPLDSTLGPLLKQPGDQICARSWADGKGMSLIPGSPWIPSPIDISPGGT